MSHSLPLLSDPDYHWNLRDLVRVPFTLVKDMLLNPSIYLKKLEPEERKLLVDMDSMYKPKPDATAPAAEKGPEPAY